MSAAVLEAPAAKAAPPGPFPFGLDQSGEAARKLLARFSGKAMAHWGRVWDNYLARKADLIRLIDPATGRVAIDLGRVTPSDQDAHGDFARALERFGWSHFSGKVSPRSVAAGLVRAGDAILTGHDGLAVTAGMKLSRALAAYMHWTYRPSADPTGMARYNIANVYEVGSLVRLWQGKCDKDGVSLGRQGRLPTDDELVPIVVGAVMEDYAARAGTPSVVLSANGLDVLTTSYNVPFVSCLNPSGEYRAGPQQYLADGHTCLVYAWREERDDPVTGLRLPYKTYRQAVHIDLASGTAQFMRPYSTNALGASALLEVRKAVAAVLARHKGLTTDAGDWYGRHFHDDECSAYPFPKPPAVGRSLASIDAPSGCRRVTLKEGGGPPRLALAWPVPCGHCALGTLDRPGSLVCYACKLAS